MIRKFAILYSVLIVLETLTGFILLLVWELISHQNQPVFNASAVVLVNFWRLLFYGMPFLLIFGILFRFFNRLKIYRPFVFSIINVLVFVGLNTLYKLIRNLPTLDFSEDLFWVTAVSIFLSPVIIYQFRYFRQLINDF